MMELPQATAVEEAVIANEPDQAMIPFPPTLDFTEGLDAEEDDDCMMVACDI